MSFEKNVEKEEIEIYLKNFFLQIFSGATIASSRKRLTSVVALALYLNIKNCSPQYIKIVHNMLFSIKDRKKSLYVPQFFVIFFTLNKIFEL